MVEVFREVRRVLREDGTLWLNLGDSYAGNATSGGQNKNDGGPAVRVSGVPTKTGDNLKPKDLVGIPWRVALALQADGWYLRQDIIWHKPNPMPESVTDRCTKAHEYVFLMAKSERYYYDAEAVSEASKYPEDNRKARQKASDYESMMGNSGQIRAVINPKGARSYLTRNRRSVWTVTTKPYGGAHFAVMPPDLVKPCILAGCPEGGVVLDPFMGSGTVAAVAQDAGRRAIGIELNPEYCKLIAKRFKQRRLV
jgi:site-specific DNA-methyltransferase (adenine-specific)